LGIRGCHVGKYLVASGSGNQWQRHPFAVRKSVFIFQGENAAILRYQRHTDSIGAICRL
jgi:hypothetical protein